MYQGQGKNNSNYKAMGVCYSNIANVHLKNGKFMSAEQGFAKAIECGEECRKFEENEGQHEYFERI